MTVVNLKFGSDEMASPARGPELEKTSPQSGKSATTSTTPPPPSFAEIVGKKPINENFELRKAFRDANMVALTSTSAVTTKIDHIALFFTKPSKFLSTNSRS